MLERPAAPVRREREPEPPVQVPLYQDPAQLGLGPAAGTAPWPGMGMPSLLADLLAAPGAAERRAVLQRALHELGFDALGYTRMRWLHGRPRPLAACTAHSDGSWAHHYFAQGYQDVDPRLQEIAASALPCIWDVDHLLQRAAAAGPQGTVPGAAQDGPARLQRFVAELRDTGARSGFMVAMSGPGPDERSCVSLRSPLAGTQRFTEALLGRTLTLAYCVHGFYSRYATPAAPAAAQAAAPAPRSELPPVQADILRNLAMGLCDKQIAARLNLSAHNVDYHMRQLRKRFGVRNRVQLLESAARTLQR
jgi:DNA-binding CsgD family transcriptional regulator